MKKQITHISVLQSSKVVAILGCLVSAVYAIPLGIYSLVKQDNEVATALFMQPLIHLVLGFITGLIVTFIYNQIVKVVGGIELNTVDNE